MQCNRGILRSKYWFTIQKCLVVWRFWFNFSIAGIPNIHTRYLLVENSNFIGDKSGRMPGSSRAEDVCWDKQGHQGLSALIHNDTMHWCIDNNTMHPMHTMQITHNKFFLFMIICFWNKILLTTLCLCVQLSLHSFTIQCIFAFYYALIDNNMQLCLLVNMCSFTIQCIQCICVIHKIVYTLQKPKLTEIK